MAVINGSFNGAWPSYATPYIEYSYSQDIANNQTTVTAYFRVLRNSSKTTAWDSTSSAYLEINGNRKNLDFSFDIRPIGVGSSMTIMSHSVTVPHNADGTKSINLSAAVYTDTSSLNDGSVSGSVTLPTIPRASSISCPTLTMGSPGTITISRASSSFTHTITASFGSASTTITTKTTGTSVPWTPLLTWAAQIPNATSGTCTLTCITYSGSAEIGRKSISITLTAPASVKPTLTSLTAARVDGSVPAAWGVYVKDKSKVKLTINGAAGNQGSTIKGYSITGGGYSSGSSSYTTGFLNTTGTIAFTATVNDSRGRTSDAKTVSITVVDYIAPTLTVGQGSRYSDSACTVQNDQGGYCKVPFSFAVAVVSNKNTHQYRVRSRTSGGTWTTVTNWQNTTAYTGSSSATGIAVSTESSYEIEISIQDSFTSVSQVATISTAATTMDFRKGGKGVAVGKVAEQDNAFDSAWPGFFKKSLTLRDAPETQLYMQPQGVANNAYLYANQDVRMGLYDDVKGIVFRYMTDDMFYFHRRVTCVARADFSDNIYCKGVKLVDSGYDRGGYYIKYYDGSMVCYKTWSVTVTTSNAFGVCYYAYGGAFIFPAVFAAAPAVVLTLEDNDMMSAAAYGVTASGADNVYIYCAVNKTKTLKIHCLALGRWK